MSSPGNNTPLGGNGPQAGQPPSPIQQGNTPNTGTPQAGDPSTSGTPQAGGNQGEGQHHTESSPGSSAGQAGVELADLQKIVAELRKENAAHRRKAKEQEDAARLSEEQRLREQGQFEELAKKAQARVQELEPIATRYAALTSVLTTQFTARIRDWPDEVKAFAPGEDAPIEERLAWLERAQALVTRLQGQQRSSAPGNAPSPPPAGGQAADTAQADELRRRYQQTGKYAF